MKNKYIDFENLQQKNAYLLLSKIEKLNSELSDLNSSFILSSSFLTKTMSDYMARSENFSLYDKMNVESGIETKVSQLNKNIEKKKQIVLEIKNLLSQLEREFDDSSESVSRVFSIIKK